MLNVRFDWLPEPRSLPSLIPPADTPISWDHEGKTLSCFGDNTWLFPGPRKGSRHKVAWEYPQSTAYSALLEENCTAGKQLALLRITHGSSIGTVAVYRITRDIKNLMHYCQSIGVYVQHFNRFPEALNKYFLTLNTASQRTFLGLARTASAHVADLGWPWLEPEQIQSLLELQKVEYQQTPVIPLDIRKQFDEVANSIIEGYLSVAGGLSVATTTWLGCSRRQRLRCTPGWWPKLVAAHPNLQEELQRWFGKAEPSPSSRASYIKLVREAAFWIIATGSAARRGEILHLRRGCFVEEQIDGTRVYRLLGSTSKTQSNDNAVWIVAPNVGKAVKALERTLDWYYTAHSLAPIQSDALFQVMDFNLGQDLPKSYKRAGRKLIGEPVGNIEFTFLKSLVNAPLSEADMTEARTFSRGLDEHKFAVGQQWPASPHQLRRTTLVHAAASGLVSQDSLSFQAKHATHAMTAYYCQKYWQLRVTAPDDPIVAHTDESLATAFSEEYAESYNRDREQIIASNRFFSPYGYDHKRQLMMRTPLLTLEEIQAGEAAEVLKRNTLGICAQAEFCRYQSSITVRGCMTNSDGKPCSKAIHDKTKIPEIEALIQDSRFRLEELRLKDTFEREQVEADISTAREAIALIQQHRDTHD